MEASLLATCGQVGDLISPLLGPNGMDKLVSYADDREVISNDSAVILDTMCVPHPLVRMIIDAGETTKRAVGDGTTTTVLLASSLVKAGLALRATGLHPALVSADFMECLDASLGVLRRVSVNIDPHNRDSLIEVATTALSKLGEDHRRSLAEKSVDAVDFMWRQADGDFDVDLRAVRVDGRAGGTLADSFVLRGVILDTVRANDDMPLRSEKAKVALLGCSLLPKKPKYDVQIRLSSPDEICGLGSDSHRRKKEMADKIVASGATVVASTGRLDKEIGALLAKNGISAFQELPEYDLECLVKATGGRRVNVFDDLSSTELGSADVVEEVEVGGDKLTFFRCPDPRAANIMIRGMRGNEKESTWGAVADSLFAVRDAIRQKKVVPGGGASEMEVAVALKRRAATIPTALQLVMKSYAEAVESVAGALFVNSGLDQIDAVSTLRTVHGRPGNAWSGLDASKKGIVDVRESGIIHPLEVKEQAFISATEAAAAVLRISEVVQLPPKPKTIGEVRKEKLERHGGRFKFVEHGSRA